MAKRRHTEAVHARVPTELADALTIRATVLGQPVSEVLRDAVAREVARPIDMRDRAAVAAWLDGSLNVEGT